MLKYIAAAVVVGVWGLIGCGPPSCQDRCEDTCEAQKSDGVSLPCQPNDVDYCRLNCGEREDQ